MSVTLRITPEELTGQPAYHDSKDAGLKRSNSAFQSLTGRFGKGGGGGQHPNLYIQA